MRWAGRRRGGRRGPTGHREGKHRQWRSCRGRGRTFGEGRTGLRRRNGSEDDNRKVGGGRIPRWCRSDSPLSRRSRRGGCSRGHGGGSGGRRRGWRTGTGRWRRGSAGCGRRKRRWPGGPPGPPGSGRGHPLHGCGGAVGVREKGQGGGRGGKAGKGEAGQGGGARGRGGGGGTAAGQPQSRADADGLGLGVPAAAAVCAAAGAEGTRDGRGADGGDVAELARYVKWAGKTRGRREKRGPRPFSDLVGRAGRPRERWPRMDEGRWRRMLGAALPGVRLDCPQEKGKKHRVQMLRELLQQEGRYGGDA